MENQKHHLPDEIVQIVGKKDFYTTEDLKKLINVKLSPEKIKNVSNSIKVEKLSPTEKFPISNKKLKQMSSVFTDSDPEDDSDEWEVVHTVHPYDLPNEELCE